MSFAGLFLLVLGALVVVSIGIYILANAMGVSVKATSGPVIDKPADLAGMLTHLEEGDILFIDEIHTIVGAGATSSASAASVSSLAVGGSTPGISELQFATRMNINSVPIKPR